MSHQTDSVSPAPGNRGEAGLARTARLVDNGLVLFEGTVIALLLAALVCAVLTQVISRYILNVSNAWTEESARYFFVWVSMIGAALGVQRGSHFGFDAVVRGLPPSGRAAAKVVGLAVVFAMATLIAAQGWQMMQLADLETGAGTSVPMPWVYAALPTGGVLIMLHVLLSIFKSREPDAGEGEGHLC